VFERFTDRARRVVVLAQEEAGMLDHHYIGTEHVLLGLIHEGEGVAAQALESLGISLEPARQQVAQIIGRGQKPPSGAVPFTPRAKKALELALREALILGDNFIGTEHILLGLLREGDGVAVQVLVRMGADLNQVRQHVTELRQAAAQVTPPAASEGIGLRQSHRDLWPAGMLRSLSLIEGRLDAIERHLGMRAGRPESAGPREEAARSTEPGSPEAGQPGSAEPEQPGSAPTAGE
jgi:ATP-dependent Clp protease ATP-binding subunit ClpC